MKSFSILVLLMCMITFSAVAVVTPAEAIADGFVISGHEATKNETTWFGNGESGTEVQYRYVDSDHDCNFDYYYITVIYYEDYGNSQTTENYEGTL
ncbi:MAG: hypothetical protein JXR03_05765 [Cyclobacteriaceae bacterium]